MAIYAQVDTLKSAIGFQGVAKRSSMQIVKAGVLEAVWTGALDLLEKEKITFKFKCFKVELHSSASQISSAPSR